MTRILAHILKHLMTTVPMLVGTLIVLYAICSYEYSWLGMAHFIVQCMIGGGLVALGYVILDAFNSTSRV